MRKLTRIALATITALGMIACAAEKGSPSPENNELEAAAAAASFREHVEAKLGQLEISQLASAAFINSSPETPGVEITYAFRGQGGRGAVTAVLESLTNTSKPLDDQRCWMPWEKLIDLKTGQPGPFMGAFHAGNFQLTLWIDQFGRDLFICYRAPPPEPPVEEELDKTTEQKEGLPNLIH